MKQKSSLKDRLVGSRYFLCFAILSETTQSIDCVLNAPQQVFYGV